jgi:hypothetical protein
VYASFYIIWYAPTDYACGTYGSGGEKHKRPDGLPAKWTLHQQIVTSQLHSGRIIFAADSKGISKEIIND